MTVLQTSSGTLRKESIQKKKENQIPLLKSCIKKIGLTQKYFAQLYYIEIYEDLNEEKINSFYEKFKGHMKRETTKSEIIDVYLYFLHEMDEFKNNNYIEQKI